MGGVARAGRDLQGRPGIPKNRDGEVRSRGGRRVSWNNQRQMSGSKRVSHIVS